MSDSSVGGEDFDRIAESFIARLRGGERPSPSEYAERHPALADKILDLFPALVEMEGLKPDADGPTGSFADEPKPSHDTALPERLGDYRILRKLGAGGMGVVYEAERESLKAHVALKVLHAQFRDDAAYRARFRNEARSAARLHHTNIVSVFDFGEHDGVLYYAMQYIAGHGLDRVLDEVRRLRDQPAPPVGDPTTTLAEALVSGRFEDGPAKSSPSVETGPDRSPDPSSHISTLTGPDRPRYHREITRIGAEVADALAYAHGRGVLHRDIKPSNLLLDARGTAWVADFGLAKFEGGEDLTDKGDVVGTLRYIAPERFDGRSDARCDIYALGVTLYEMLALHHAFEDLDRARLIRRILGHEPTPLRKLDPRISLDLATVVHKAMAREPADRFANAADLAAELRRVAANQPIKSRRIPWREQSWRWCKRNPVVASLNALAATLTIVIAIVSTTAAIWLDRSKTDLENQLILVRTAETEKSEQLWDANLARARASRHMKRSGQRFDALAAITEATKLGRQLNHPPERFDMLRNEAIAALALPDIQTTRQFGQLADDIVTADVDENFELYVVGERRGQCIVRRIADDTEFTRLPPNQSPRNIAFGTGRLLIEVNFEEKGGLKLWDLSGPEPVVRIDEPRTIVSHDFRPDGRQLVLVHPDNTLDIYDLTTWRRRILSRTTESLQGPVLRHHPTAPYIVLNTYFSQTVQIRNLETGETLVVDPPWPGGCGACEWGPDGRILAVSSGDTDSIALYEFVASPPAVRLIRTIEGASSSSFLRFNATGDRLFARGWGNYMDMFDVESGRKLFKTPIVTSAPTGRIKADKRRQHLFPGSVGEPIRRLAYSSVAEGRECRLMTPTSLRADIGLAKVSPDGRLAVVNSADVVALFDLQTAREVGTIEIPGRSLNFRVNFEPNGHLLTNSNSFGCYRWPVRSNSTKPGNVVIGPPERLPLHPGEQVSTSRDGAVVAQAMYNGYKTAPYAGGWILHRDRLDPARNVAPGISMSRAEVSPDGRWVAFSGVGGGVVYDAQTEQPVWRSLRGGPCGFSPNGKWLASQIDNGRLYSVGDWEPGPQLGHGEFGGFSADGTTAVLGTDAGYLRLVEVETGRELARFEGPDPYSAQSALTPDGTKLLEPRKDGVLVWDLRRIRAELAAIGLDWDAPPFPPEVKPAGPLTVTILGAELLDPQSTMSRTRKLLAPWLKGSRAGSQDYLDRADELASGGWHEMALRDYESLVRRHPEFTSARMHRGLEWFRRGRWEAAAADFAAVLAGDPSFEFRGPARSRLAWSYHEQGRHADAAAELVKLLEASPESRRAEDRTGLLLLRAEFYDRAGKPDQAKADRNLAAKLHPKLAEAANSLAWGWLTPELDRTPQENWRFVPAALLLARKAVALNPNDPMSQNTLGMALYRSGKYSDAKAALEASFAISKGTQDAWDLFPLAMCQHHLGDRKAALASYDRASAWKKSHEGSLDGDPRELADLQTETRRLLGLPD